MADDWQVGDLALCVDDGPMKIIDGLNETNAEAVRNLRKGAIYHVDIIARGKTVDCLGIAERKRRAGGCSTRFRKIRPLSDEERDSFLADLKLPEATDA